MVNKHMVWGSAKQKKRMDEVQAEFPLSEIQMAQLDPDVNCVVIPNRT
jgi:hypothetical protein